MPQFRDIFRSARLPPLPCVGLSQMLFVGTVLRTNSNDPCLLITDSIMI